MCVCVCVPAELLITWPDAQRFCFCQLDKLLEWSARICILANINNIQMHRSMIDRKCNQLGEPQKRSKYSAS